MKLTNWFLNFDFTGRGRRSHSWANWATWFAVWIVTFGIISAIGSAGPSETVLVMQTESGPATTVTRDMTLQSSGAGTIGGILLLIVVAASFVDSLAMTFRRAHDTNKSGWIFLMLFVPLVNFVALYWLLIEDSQQGPNKYGPAVKRFYEPDAATA